MFKQSVFLIINYKFYCNKEKVINSREGSKYERVILSRYSERLALLTEVR